MHMHASDSKHTKAKLKRNLKQANENHFVKFKQTKKPIM